MIFEYRASLAVAQLPTGKTVESNPIDALHKVFNRLKVNGNLFRRFRGAYCHSRLIIILGGVAVLIADFEAAVVEPEIPAGQIVRRFVEAIADTGTHDVRNFLMRV